MCSHFPRPLWQPFSELRLSPGETRVVPDPLVDPTSSDPLTVQTLDLEHRCLCTLITALRAVIAYAHSSYRVPISFQVKRFDKTHGQVWVKVSPDEIPEGYDLKYLLQHMKFYENLPRYAQLLCTDDYKLRGTCQYFLDLQSRRSESPSTEARGSGKVDLDISRVKDTVIKAATWVQDMRGAGLADRDVVRELRIAQGKLRDISYTVSMHSKFHCNQSELIRRLSAWYPEKQQLAAKSVHQQMSSLMEDPEVMKFVLLVVAPRLGIVPFSQFDTLLKPPPD